MFYTNAINFIFLLPGRVVSFCLESPAIIIISLSNISLSHHHRLRCTCSFPSSLVYVEHFLSSSPSSRYLLPRYISLSSLSWTDYRRRQKYLLQTKIPFWGKSMSWFYMDWVVFFWMGWLGFWVDWDLSFETNLVLGLWSLVLIGLDLIFGL